MLEGKETFCVILRRADSFPLQELAALLSGAFGVPVHDAAAGLRRNWGLLLKTDELGRAKGLSQRLAVAGFDSFIIAASELRQLPPLKNIRKASFSERGLIIETGLGPAGCAGQAEIPWGSFASALVCAGSFIEEEVSISGGAQGPQDGPGIKISDIVKSAAFTIATGMPSLGKLKPGQKKDKGGAPAKRQGLSHYLDIISPGGLSPGGVAFRVCGESFDYSYLGGGKEYSSLLNFGKLARDVLSFLPQAVKNRGAVALGNGTGAGIRYAGKDEYEAERFWLLQLL